MSNKLTYANNDEAAEKPDRNDELGKRLERATPKLITCVQTDPLTPTQFRLEPIIRARPIDGEITLRENYYADPSLSPLRRPVFVRVIRRGADDYFYTSTFESDREEVLRGWGEAGLLHADPDGRFITRIETLLTGDAKADAVELMKAACNTANE
jgi:hypothetical protein